MSAGVLSEETGTCVIHLGTTVCDPALLQSMVKVSQLENSHMDKASFPDSVRCMKNCSMLICYENTLSLILTKIMFALSHSRASLFLNQLLPVLAPRWSHLTPLASPAAPSPCFWGGEPWLSPVLRQERGWGPGPGRALQGGRLLCSQVPLSHGVLPCMGSRRIY